MGCSSNDHIIEKKQQKKQISPSLCVCLQVLINDNSNMFVITGLKPLTEYEVSLSGIYRDESESDPMEIIETTGQDHPSSENTHLFYDCK